MLCILIPADEIRVGLKEEVYIFEPDLREVCTVLSHFCRVQLFVTLWTIAHQAPLSMGFSWQEYLSGMPCPPPRDIPDQGIEPSALKSRVMAGRLFITSTTWEAHIVDCSITKQLNPYGNIMERYHFSFYSSTHFYTRPHFWFSVPRSCFC